MIQADEKYFFVGNGTKIKMVCTKCNDRYKRQATVARETYQRAIPALQPTANKNTDANVQLGRSLFTPAAPALSSGSSLGRTSQEAPPALMLPPPVPKVSRYPTAASNHSGMRPNPKVISEMVIASHKKDTHKFYQNKVVPISSTAHHGPAINLYASSSSGVHPLARLPATGYSRDHKFYEEQKSVYQRAAYAKGGDVLPVRLTLGHGVLGKPGVFIELSELSDLKPQFDAHATIPEIRREAMKYAITRLQAHGVQISEYQDFVYEWNTDNFSLRDITINGTKQYGSGVDLDTEEVAKQYGLSRPYLLNVHGKIVTKGKNGDTKWEPNKKTGCVLRVSIRGADWEQFVDAVEQYREEQEQSSTAMARTMSKQLSNNFVSSSAQEVSILTSGKRARSDSLAKTPPRNAIRLPPMWKSPQQHVVEEGLAQGGRMENKPVVPNDVPFAIQGLFAIIPQLDIQVILSNKSLQRLDLSNHIVGPAMLMVNFGSGESELGIGAFKTAHKGRLSLLGEFDKERFPGIDYLLDRKGEVCVKQFYTHKQNGQGHQVKVRLEKDLEYNKIQMEANVHYWSASLINMGYSYAAACQADATWPVPFSDIPQLRYVAAGVFLVLKEGSNELKRLNGAQVSRSFLIEEVIPGDDFVKYVHNSCATPEIGPEDSDFPKAEFLLAMQHVQYEKLYRTVYVSDFQGSGNLLTDAQVMTSPALVEENTSMFGDGNVDVAFKNFPRQHVCNPWCRWFGFNDFVFDDLYSETPRDSCFRKPKV
ncbi:hypothetical protein VNI00_008427 [Paramarasmius palmivorus]|uniref:Alpha-type protein kinase domain-containing protein n=1 Tax=Paramarasmius palmivorus TaxID=297713 RepID=A0AAW0BU12_9AGAR